MSALVPIRDTYIILLKSAQLFFSISVPDHKEYCLDSSKEGSQVPSFSGVYVYRWPAGGWTEMGNKNLCLRVCPFSAFPRGAGVRACDEDMLKWRIAG